MSRSSRVVNLRPGDVDLEWDDDAPVLVFLEYRDGVLHKVRVRLKTYVAQGVARVLHLAQNQIERRASELLRALRGA